MSEFYTKEDLVRNLATYVDKNIFPCSLNNVIRNAEDNYAPDELLDAIEQINKDYFDELSELKGEITRN